MKDITYEMVRDFRIKELGYDFMGYYRQPKDLYTYHHTITPKRYGGKETYENGSILFSTPHSYLHRIEDHELEAFYYITYELVAMNTKGYLDPVNIRRIHEVLRWFESHYGEEMTGKGKVLVKKKYLNRIEF